MTEINSIIRRAESNLGPGKPALCRLHMYLQLLSPRQTQLHGGNSIRASSVTPKVTPKISGCPRSLPIVSERHFQLIRVRHPYFSRDFRLIPSSPIVTDRPRT